MRRWQSAAFLIFIFCLTSGFAQQRNVAKLSAVPFVGCKSDGQVGPLDAPSAGEVVEADAGIAGKLAYYKAENGPGVLAPRGWYCVGTYGSAGAHVFVTPQPVRPESLLSANAKSFTGPAIQADSMSGGTSGRFAVAQTVARVFPAHLEFARQVIQEGLFPASDFPMGPYPKDQLTYKSDHVVEFRTPPHTDGLGTASYLQANDHWIDGVAILGGPETYLMQLTVRMPADLHAIELPIVEQFEKEWVDRPDH